MNIIDVVENQRKSEERLFAKPPRVNVISKEAYENRVHDVFQILHHALSKSFGPYGAPTIIYNYPYSHVTKDGFTIMKNLSMDATDQLVDQSIANTVSDICGRLNYTVGDGTTSAVIATNNIYNSYINDHKAKLEAERIMPRNVLAAFETVKKDIIENLNKYVTPIQSNDMDELYNNIYKVVYISSNGDEAISKMIADLYKEIGYPGINSVLAEGGESKCRVIRGYQFEAALLDRLYINSDDDVLNIDDGADIIIFQTKITKTIYDTILKPLNEACRARGRRLIVCAPTYDETALGQTIRHDLTSEFKAKKTVNMVLCAYKAISDYTRQVADDFAMLCNTTIIDRELKAMIAEKIEAGIPIHEIFNLDRRDNIPNLMCAGVINPDNRRMALYRNGHSEDMVYEGQPIIPLELPNDALRLGYVGKCSIGLKTSIFTDFYYNQNMYDATVKEAETSLKEVEDLYSRLGTFNLAVSQAQQRLYALRLKMGVIDISADGELSQKMIKDSVDDAIRAAESAFKYGIINGCNVDLIRSIDDCTRNYYTWNEFDNESERDFKSMETIQKDLVKLTTSIVRDGFCDVYRSMLTNAFADIPLVNRSELYPNTYINDEVISGVISVIQKYLHNKNIFNNILEPDTNQVREEIIRVFYDIDPDDVDFMDDILINYDTTITRLVSSTIEDIFECNENIEKVTLYDFIVEFSIATGMVFDVSKREFNSNVINSMQTDVEILKATVDLIALLIAGNQMVVTQKHNF